MKIAFPVEKDMGLESQVFGHFGSAAGFIIVDTNTGNAEFTTNMDADHTHGNCQPLAALGNQPVDAVVVGGIGGGALMKLNAAGIHAYRGISGSVAENLEFVSSGKLPRFTMNQTCRGDHHDGHCAH